MGDRVLTMLAVVPEWFRLLLWPAFLRADYGPSELVGQTVWGPAQTLGVLLLVSAVALAAAAWRRAPVVTFGIAWCAIGLFPVHNVLAPTGILLAERTLFLPSIGAMIAIGGIGAWVLERVGAPIARLVALMAALLVGVGIYRSNVRHQIWSDQFTLWYHTANVDAPKSFRAHEALAETYFDIGVEQMAEREYRLAIQYAPRTLTRPTLEYAERLRSRGFCFRAAELYRKVIEVHPQHLPARASLIACLLDLGYYQQAVFHARMGVTFDWERPVFQMALVTADSALRVGAPPGTVRVAVPTGLHTRGHMMIFEKK
jgi:tetratricopeptide (TPR) repeat protein